MTSAHIQKTNPAGCAAADHSDQSAHLLLLLPDAYTLAAAAAARVTYHHASQSLLSAVKLPCELVSR
jgi:hypothetical protein